MENKNCENIKNCNSCYSCDYCDYCGSCDYCDYCGSCGYCDYCGYCDSCYYCNSCAYCYFCKFSYGLRMSENMLFCLGNGKWENNGGGYQKNYRIFNKEVSEEVFKKAYNNPEFKLPVSVWIDKKDMSEQEKKNYSIYEQIGGYLKVLSYKDAWKEGWENSSKEFKDWVKGLPNFDAKIFEEITGIDISKCDVVKPGDEIEVCIKGKTFKAKII